MRKVLFFVVAMAMSCALAGCNVAPNVPGVSPYATPGVYGTAPGYGNYVGRGSYGNNTGRGNYGGNKGRMFGNNVGKGAIGNNRSGGNLPANGNPPAYIPGGQSYGLR